MNLINLLRGDNVVIDKHISIKHLKLNEVIDFANSDNGEERFFSVVNLFILRPYDLMDKLDDVGIDFETISEYELFITLFRTGQYDNDIKYLIGEHSLKVMLKTDTDQVVLYDEDTGATIDENIYLKIKEWLLKILHISITPPPKSGNESAKKFRINKKRKERQKNEKNKEFNSQLHDLVSSILVGTNGTVNFSNIWDLPLYTAYTLFTKMLKLQSYKNTMIGIYTGNISSKDVPKATLDWTNNL